MVVSQVVVVSPPPLRPPFPLPYLLLVSNYAWCLSDQVLYEYRFFPFISSGVVRSSPSGRLRKSIGEAFSKQKGTEQCGF